MIIETKSFPLQEFYEVSLNPNETGMTGVKQENVCAGPLNSGMFTAMLERGDVKAVCCGHDHTNDYAAEFCGFKLCYSSNIGYDTYHDSAVMGGRMFIVHESNPDEIETYLSYVNGINLNDVMSASDAVLDFEDADAYTADEGAASAEGVGQGCRRRRTRRFDGSESHGRKRCNAGVSAEAGRGPVLSSVD